METSKLKKFAQFARRTLMEQVAGRMEVVLAKDSAARRENAKAVEVLERRVAEVGKKRVVEQVAYTWFNRFCALRYMDVNRVNRVRVVSPSDPGQFQPEILAEAKAGHVDEEIGNKELRAKILSLLSGASPSEDAQGEAYRLLVVAVCNAWHASMPFLFEKIADYTELLMPSDLLSGSSILAYTREAMTPAACEDVEVIGWLYQFYISEKKDQVFQGLKNNKKITAENIPAATQLFTPHWIVRYLVENSLGRLWMLNRPQSGLMKKMDYYIRPEEPETDFLKIGSPEEIRICDPACGSGHMLTYAFDLLYAIYDEEGYESSEIPAKILKHNLYGIEIDERAGELAAFALVMKAQQYDKRFFRRSGSGGETVEPNICVLQNVHFETDELTRYMAYVGHDLFTAPLQTTLHQFEEADNFGSLIRPEVTDVAGMLEILESKNVTGQLFIRETHLKVLKALRQADYLSPKYHVVVANPPYMGGKGMNPRLTSWVKDNFPESKSDLFAMFIERNIELSKNLGSVAMITMQSWMFLSRHERLRVKILENSPIQDMAHLGTNAFDSIGGEVVSTTAFILNNSVNPELNGRFIDLKDGTTESEKQDFLFDAVAGKRIIYSASARDFELISGAPIAYWLSSAFRRNFEILPALKDVFKPAVGLNTGKNDRFLRQWFEVAFQDIYFTCDSVESAKELPQKWFPYNKGGSYRKWYGNQSFVLNWENNGFELKEFATERNAGKHWSRYIQNLDCMFKECITWSDITTNSFAARYSPEGFLFDVKGSSGIPNSNGRIDVTLSLLCSKLMPAFMKCVNPTSTFQVGDLSRVPYKCPTTFTDQQKTAEQFDLVEISKKDWDQNETSWGFTSLPLLNPDFHQQALKATYQKLRAHWREMTLEMTRLEEENNRIFIDAYGLQDELTPEVPLNEITLTCNPHYRYGGDKTEDELEAMLLADTLQELVSFAVGCMFGRYSLDKPGLILANQGESLKEYLFRIGTRTDPLDEKRAMEDPDSVVFLENATVRCFACDTEMPVDEARFVIAAYDEENPQQGRPLCYCPKCADSDRASYVSWQQPLKNFSARQALDRKWCEPETLAAFLSISGCFGHRIPMKREEVRFLPDADNVIPILDGDWFTDDITERFRDFLRVAFGEEHYEENLAFVEEGLNLKGKRNYGIRDYFLREFYDDHVKRYKKRPIYWLFSSPKGSFNALIYMHRYRPDTVSVVLNEYLREFREKLSSRMDHLRRLEVRADVAKGEKTKAIKEIESIRKTLDELEDWEREVLYPMATERIEIDLDDGVKVNYPKFNGALKKVPGLS